MKYKGYKREKDVIEQMKLVSDLIYVRLSANPIYHAWNISDAVNLQNQNKAVIIKE